MLVAQLLVAQLALLVILVISHSQATEPPGVKLSLSQKGLDYSKSFNHIHELVGILIGAPCLVYRSSVSCRDVFELVMH